MRVATGLESYRPAGRPACVALGTFDGLHRGHRAVIDAVQVAASEKGGEAVATTFDPHPAAVIAPPRGPYLLSTIDERIALFESTGIATLVIVRFDAALREMPAEAWLALLESRLRPVSIVVSSTHAFGRNREGTTALLQGWGTGRGIDVRIIPPVTNGGVVISSTSVRELLRDGDVQTAAGWLGRWYSVRGRVVPGAGRGRQIGVPTANLEVPEEKIVPAQGVYAAYASVAGRTYPSVVNIGVRPTFGPGALAVEAHFLDATVQAYGAIMTLAFVRRLRSERRFPSVEALREQIVADIEDSRRLLKTNGDIDRV